MICHNRGHLVFYLYQKCAITTKYVYANWSMITGNSFFFGVFFFLFYFLTYELRILF